MPYYTDKSPGIFYALEQIRGTYGDICSVDDKRKSLLKFGRNENVQTTASTIMTFPAGVQTETFVSTNAITHIASDDAADTQEVVVEGHTISGSDLTFVIQSVTLQGTTKTALTTPLARCTRAYNNGSTDLAGDVYVAQDVTFTGGVPQTATAIHLLVPAADNQSKKASTSISKDDYWIVTNAYIDVLEKTSAFVHAKLQVRKVGKVFRTAAAFSASSTGGRGFIDFDPPLIIEKNSDVRLQAFASANGTDVSGGIQGYLAQVKNA